MSRNSLILICLTCLLTAACHRANVASSTATTTTPVQPTTTEPRKPGPNPTEAEIRAAITRNYADVVTIDQTKTVSFLVGDFNGDHSEDIAIVVKPEKGKLSELNSEYVNWILEDPRQHRSTEQKSRPTPVVIGRNDVLLAVIHGHEGQGWRSESARQTYLLKNAVGVNLEIENAKTLNEGRSLPSLRGDVIREKLDGAGGIIYWTGAKYSWHPVI